jgi:hypothetical protein
MIFLPETISMLNRGLPPISDQQIEDLFRNKKLDLKATIDKVETFSDLDKFRKASDVILTNRMVDELLDIKEKIYSRDLYGES